MNSRNKKQHIEVMDRLSSLKYAMNNPSPDGIKVLRKAIQFIKKQHEPKSLSDSKTVPQIDMSYLNGFVNTLTFNMAGFRSKLEEIDNPKKYVRQLEFGPPISIIKNIMSAPRIGTDSLSAEEKKCWTKILNMKMDLTAISELLDKITPEGAKAAQISARVLALVILVIGTILTNYILLIIAAGLISVDITIDKYMEECALLEQNASILDVRKQPYFISGVYPLIHVNREKEHKEITFNQNTAFIANNMIELINKIHAYIDFLDIPSRRTEDIKHFPLEHLETMIRSMWSTCSPTEVNTLWVRDTKDKILSISRMCCTENFIMDQPSQARFLTQFLYRIEHACRELAGTQNGLTNDMTPTELVPMFEALFLQIWDAFLTQNQIKKNIPQVNQYVSTDMKDDTPSIIMFYNNLQPLDYGRKEPDANSIISRIFESVGSKAPGYLLTEAAPEQDTGKIVDHKVTACTKNIQWHKEKRNNAVRNGVKWMIQNNASLVDRMKRVTKESKGVTMYSMNAANVGSALQLLELINTYLTTDYFKNRDNAPNNINELIMKAFPGAGITDPNKQMSGDQLANMIGSGSRGEIPKKDLTGTELQKWALSVVAYFADTKVAEYWNSDVFDRIEKTLANFKINATNANRKPITEEVEVDDSIFATFEADQAPAPATPTASVPVAISSPTTPASPTQTPAPGTNIGGNANEKPVVTNQSAAKDAAVISHASDIIGNILNIVYSMTVMPQTVVVEIWNSIGVNMSNNPQQQPQQAQPGQPEDANATPL